MTSSIYHYKFQKALQLYVPDNAVDYCFNLWKHYPFVFKIRKPRISKAGDYCYIPSKKQHIITINKNLNPYSFLITYIHEVAHLVAFEKYGRKILPHGKEWKYTFTQLMLPMLNNTVFPEDVLKVAVKHFKNPKASTAGDPALVRVLNDYNIQTHINGIMLEDIPMGCSFTFRSKTYKKLEKRRTRILCAESVSGRKFLINKAAIVEQES